ncbi:MAG: hypothetical protein ACOX5G_11190 [Kiritimatiellia bacterium]|jgi:hypothetical protein
MNEEPNDFTYTAPQVTEEYFDSGGNYVDTPYTGSEPYGNSPVDPGEGDG